MRLPQAFTAAEAFETSATLADDARIDADRPQRTGVTHRDQGRPGGTVIGYEQQDDALISHGRGIVGTTPAAQGVKASGGQGIGQVPLAGQGEILA